MANPGNEEGHQMQQLSNSISLDAKIDSIALRKERVDKAFETAAVQLDAVPVDETTSRRLLRRIDWYLMPTMCIIYGLNFLDKQALSYASVMGIESYLRLMGNNYEWLASMFYFGYMAWEYPTNRLLQRLPIAKYCGGSIIAWGVILCCFAVVHDFQGALALRLMLGIAEAAVTPAFALLTSQWYTRSEQGSRTAVWFSFNGWAQMIGGFLAYGIAKGTAHDQTALPGWQILFLTCGALTAAMGVAFLLIVPDSPLNAWWLTEEDRILAIRRIQVNQQGIGNKHFKWYQLREAVADPMTWAFVLFGIASTIPNGGIGNFFGLLIKSFGYTSEQSLLYSAPAGAVTIVVLIASGYLGDKVQNRLLVSLVGLVVAEIGISLVIGLGQEAKIGRLIGYYLVYASIAPFVALLSMISTNIAGWTKKTTVAAFYLISYCVGNLIGPQTFRAQDAPGYVPAEITIIICWGICICDLIVMYFYWRHQNGKKAFARAQPGYVKLPNSEWRDLTDKENVEFVYAL